MWQGATYWNSLDLDYKIRLATVITSSLHGLGEIPTTVHSICNKELQKEIIMTQGHELDIVLP